VAWAQLAREAPFCAGFLHLCAPGSEEWDKNKSGISRGTKRIIFPSRCSENGRRHATQYPSPASDAQGARDIDVAQSVSAPRQGLIKAEEVLSMAHDVHSLGVRMMESMTSESLLLSMDPLSTPLFTALTAPGRQDDPTRRTPCTRSRYNRRSCVSATRTPALCSRPRDGQSCWVLGREQREGRLTEFCGASKVRTTLTLLSALLRF
jgi:hypothetical protein